jgi:DnaJ-class molecular chaperone
MSVSPGVAKKLTLAAAFGHDLKVQVSDVSCSRMFHPKKDLRVCRRCDGTETELDGKTKCSQCGGRGTEKLDPHGRNG